MVPTELDLERAIRDLLEWDGWIVRKMERNYSERKRKSVGELGMPDLLAIRYIQDSFAAEVLWIEVKRTFRQKATKAAGHQHEWHTRERRRGAFTVIAGEDFEASIDGFKLWYRREFMNEKN